MILLSDIMSCSAAKNVCFGRLIPVILLLALAGGVLCAQTPEHRPSEQKSENASGHDLLVISGTSPEGSLRRGGVWNYLTDNFFSDGRAATVSIRRIHHIEKMGKLPEITSGVTYNNIQQLQHSRRIGNTSSNAHPVNTADAVRSVPADRIRKISVKCVCA